MLHNLLKVIFVNLNSLIFQIIHSQNSQINNLAAFEFTRVRKKKSYDYRDACVVYYL